MNETISIVADICGILGFLLGIFAVSKVFKLKQEIKGNDNNTVNFKGNVDGGFVGRDKN